MPKTIRNQYDKKLTYENLIQAHIESRKGKSLRKEIILFNLKKEEYIMWLYEKLKNGTYTHSGYTEFYVTEPKLRIIEKSIYMDRIAHRWYVDNFMNRVLTGEAITTIMVRIIQPATATTTIRPMLIATMVSVSHSNINSDYIFQGIYTVIY